MSAPALSNEALKRHAHEVLQGEDYQQYYLKDQAFDWLSWLSDWLKFPSFKTGKLPDVVWWVLTWGVRVLVIMALIVLLLWLGARLFAWLRRLSTQSPQEARVSLAQRQDMRDALLMKAKSYAQDGRYREAIHALLLSAITYVIRDAHFAAAEFLTNRELVLFSDFERLRVTPETRAVLESMVVFDEGRWFGNESSTEADFKSFELLYQRFTQGLMVKGQAP